MDKPTIIYRKSSDAVPRIPAQEYVIKNFITKDDLPDISIATAQLSSSGIHEAMSNRSDRIYYFINASDCKITFNGKATDIEPDSVLFIPKNTRYTLMGNFKALIINTPAFDKDKEVKI
ncbi:MAG: hypothetical protein LBU87_00650 [Lactobacillales bacterium]|jgi:mannose-6-phosphate isomerase-like protein (cupin superfamily)|nr:hypothetical protein [Lactobacillales bacterium]